MGLYWDDPSWSWDDVILWDASPLVVAGGTAPFPLTDSVSKRVPRRRRRRDLFWG